MRYFLLTKPVGASADDDEHNQILFLDHWTVYALPSNHTEYHRQNGLFEKYVIEWSRQFCSKDKLFLDSGAHTGTYALSLACSCREASNCW